MNTRAPVFSAMLLLSGLACTAGVKPSGTGAGGGSGAVSGGGGTLSNNGGGGTTSSSGSGGSNMYTVPDGGYTRGDGAACQQMEVKFTATNPSVFILVDRSGSEFDSNTTGVFFTLRTAVEQVISSTVGGSSLDSQVRFGVGSFVGDHSSGTCALNFQQVPIALNNAANIKTAYDGWGPLQPYGSKSDTPMVEALPEIQQLLKSDPGTGQKYVMIVSDGETDFCDDGDALCPADAVTYEIQQMYQGTPQIQTLVVGLTDQNMMLNPIESQVLQNFANAGAGQPVVIPTGEGATVPLDIYYQCNGTGTAAGTSSWSSLATAAQRTMTSLATYSATAGTAQLFTPTATDTQSLVTAISMALSGVRSCTFDLSTFQIDLTKLNEAQVSIIDGNGQPVPLTLDPTNTNGWDMSTKTELQLYGSACDMLRDPKTMDIKFNFPCDIIIQTN